MFKNKTTTVLVLRAFLLKPLLLLALYAPLMFLLQEELKWTEVLIWVLLYLIVDSITLFYDIRAIRKSGVDLERLNQGELVKSFSVKSSMEEILKKLGQPGAWRIKPVAIENFADYTTVELKHYQLGMNHPIHMTISPMDNATTSVVQLSMAIGKIKWIGFQLLGIKSSIKILEDVAQHFSSVSVEG